jgi:N-methylhydantoinase B
VLSITTTNVRPSERNSGDLKVQIAAMDVGERRVHELTERFAVDMFCEIQRKRLRYAERGARQIKFVRRLPDEDDQDGNPCPVAVKLTLDSQGVSERNR